MSLFVHELTWRPKIVNVRNQIDESYWWCEEALTQAMNAQGSPSTLEKQVDSIVWGCMARLSLNAMSLHLAYVLNILVSTVTLASLSLAGLGTPSMLFM